MTIDDSLESDRADALRYSTKAKEFVELHDQVESSISLLDSLEGFLSTFQNDLTDVSGQISSLQDRSKDIENRLKARKKIEKPLSSLLTDLCIPPPLAKTILDTDVTETWLTAIPDLEAKLNALSARKRVKAARDLTEVAEGLRIVAATKIRVFFLAIIQPVKTSMTTNMQVLQTSILVKYHALYAFLQNCAEDVAKEIQRAYIATARVYYETGFRRYTRSLGWIKTRSVEKSDAIGALDTSADIAVDEDRLAYARLDGPAVLPAYLGEDKAHKEPVEAVFRSMLLVLMDNATAEYTFLLTFFAPPPKSLEFTEPYTAMFSPMLETHARKASVGLTDETGSPPRRHAQLGGSRSDSQDFRPSVMSKAEEAALTNMWKQILEPTLNYCQTFASSSLEPPPPVIPLLTIIRLIEHAIAEVQVRRCGPLENWMFGLRMQFWPVFQKLMSEQISGVTKLCESSAGGYFRRGANIADANVKAVAMRYSKLFSSFVLLTETEETVVFSNLNKLRQELTTLIVDQGRRLNDPLKTAMYQSTIYEMLLQAMNKGHYALTHPKAQAELAYWREREEESRRRIVSSSRPTS